MPRYSSELKASVLKRMMPPQSLSVTALSRETGITEVTLYHWRKQARQAGAVMPGNDNQQSDTWDSASKFAVVLETASLNEQALAEYCRSKGLFVEQVRAWRQVCEDANSRQQEKTADVARQQKADKQHIKALERELHRKDKALAEAAALLVLAKKYRGLVIPGEDD